MSSSRFKVQVLRAPTKNAAKKKEKSCKKKKKAASKKRKNPPARRVIATKAKRDYSKMKKRHKKVLNSLKKDQETVKGEARNALKDLKKFQLQKQEQIYQDIKNHSGIRSARLIEKEFREITGYDLYSTKGVAGGTRIFTGLGVKYKVTTSQFIDPLEQIN
jgi:hypothetical protein